MDFADYEIHFKGKMSQVCPNVDVQIKIDLSILRFH